jgi:AraC family transcriptional regulator
MNWFDIVNKATTYIEDNIVENITSEDVSKHVHFSHSHFLIIFRMLTTFTLSEYVRNRRLSLASYDVTQTNMKIVDIAFKYQYQSHEAFSRAFKTMHGVSPMTARKEHRTLSFFPQIYFDMPMHNIQDMNYQYKHYNDRHYNGIVTHISGSNTHHQIVLAQERFCKKNNIESLFDTQKPITTIIYNVTGRYEEYDYFIGVESDKHDDTEATMTLPQAEYIQYTARTTDVRNINLFKDKIFNEWSNIEYLFDGYHEIDWVIKDDDWFNVFFCARIKP